MPCDQQFLMTVSWKDADVSVLKAALIRAGFTIYSENAEGNHLYFRNNTGLRGQFVNGAFVVPQGTDLAPIKAEYSKEAVERAAAKFNWKVKKVNTNKYLLTRRAY